jgi:RNA recognition motif-containing protein
MNIFVGSLSFKIEESQLQEIFEAYGEVSSVKIIIDKISGRSKGFGFVEMPNEDEAKKAIAELNNAEVEGRAIVVNQAEEKKREPRQGGFRGGNSGGGYNKGGFDKGGFNKGGFNRGGGGFNKGGFNRGGDNRGGGNRRSDY